MNDKSQKTTITNKPKKKSSFWSSKSPEEKAKEKKDKQALIAQKKRDAFKKKYQSIEKNLVNRLNSIKNSPSPLGKERQMDKATKDLQIYLNKALDEGWTKEVTRVIGDFNKAYNLDGYGLELSLKNKDGKAYVQRGKYMEPDT